MPADITWREAINRVLTSSSIPLHYNEITQQIISGGLRANVGATPSATVNAHIAASIKHDGTQSPYVRVSKGTFTLATKSLVSNSTPPNNQQQTVTVNDDEEDQYDIVTSFGMFWRRTAIEWSATPKLWGMQQLGDTPVDFNKQIGIYLLYDGREVIYIGRSTDRPLGRRLYEHTNDRLAVRWDRFSWFGLRPIEDNGTLGDLPPNYEATTIIPALEAILIEALEPRQNRKRGDDLSAVEFIQHEDPAIQRRRMRETLEQALNKLSP
jgi:hypothetical protein